jgi:predicted RNA-binding Zn-ribbon protein involved in translation (DUF1610 family)
VTTTRKHKSGFFIGVGCPGCGGDLDLDGDFFVTGCEHCGSPLRVLMPDAPPAFMVQSKVGGYEIRNHIDRYLKKNDLPLTGSTLHTKRLYYPYWKADATLLKLRNKTEVRKFVSDSESQTESTIETNRSVVSISPYSITIAGGIAMNGIPDSIGMRSETIRIVPFAEENIEPDFDTLPVMRSWEAVNQRVMLSVASMSMINPADFGRNVTRLFNASFSLIYFPYLIVECYGSDYRRFVLDGLVGRVLKAIWPGQEASKVAVAAAAEPENASKFGDGQVSIGRVSISFGNDPTPVPLHNSSADQALARGAVDDPEDDLSSIPEVNFGQLDVDFHRCRVCGSDLPIEMSYVYICPNCHELQMLRKDAARLPEIRVAVADDDQDIKYVPFWTFKLPEVMAHKYGNLLGGLDKQEIMLVPALRASNFEAIYRLAKRMSAAQGRMATETVGELDDRYQPVRIGASEALALAEIIVCRELLDKGHHLPDDDLGLKPQDIGLVYVPFRLKNYFYIDAVLDAVSVERKLLD